MNWNIFRRSGSEIYERLPTDASLIDDVNEPLSPCGFPDERMGTPSDDSDIYSHVDMYHQEGSSDAGLLKSTDIKTGSKILQGELS